MNIQQINSNGELTNEHQEGYSNGGDIFMPIEDEQMLVPPPAIEGNVEEQEAKANAVAKKAAEQAAAAATEAQAAAGAGGDKKPPEDTTATGSPDEGGDEDGEEGVFKSIYKISSDPNVLAREARERFDEELKYVRDPARKEELIAAREEIIRQEVEIKMRSRMILDTVGRPSALREQVIRSLSADIELHEDHALTPDEEKESEERKERFINREFAKAERLQRIIVSIEARGRDSIPDYQRSYDQIDDGIQRGEIDSLSSREFRKILAGQIREHETKRIHPETRIIAEIRRTGEGTYARTEALKKAIDDNKLNPDNGLSEELLTLIAEDEEAAEKFLNKIISKPFDKESGGYRLSWYAEINLQSFMTFVKNIDKNRGTKGRYERYIELEEVSQLLHETNRATSVHSGEIEAFLNIARTVTHKNLQAGIEIDGVEQVRQLMDKFLGRVYGSHNEITEKLYETEVIERTREELKSLAGKGRFKSRYLGKDGKPRILEDWEIDRAFVIGRNFHASFFRVAELVSWGHVPEATEGWLKSIRGETIVRIMAGYKGLADRFRSGQTLGAPQYIACLNGALREDHEGGLKAAGVDGKGIKMLGELGYIEDVAPVAAMSTGGFDKGWRTVQAYLGSDLMRLSISDSDYLNQLSPEARTYVERFIKDNNEGNINSANLADFLININEFVSAHNGQTIRIAGELVPTSRLPYNEKKASAELEEILLPLLGFTVKPEAEEYLKGIRKEAFKTELFDGEVWRKRLDGTLNKNTGEYEYKYFNYNPSKDQINHSLGVLIAQGTMSDNMKTILWRKTAEVLPTRIAYFLAKEGVRTLPHYEKVKGEGYNLFNREFEDKLIDLEFIRLQKQEEFFKEKHPHQELTLKELEEFFTKNSPHQALKLEDYFDEAGLTDENEKAFVRELQNLGREKALELAKLKFPHVAFLDDVPFQKANYIRCGPEVVARRLGSDLTGFHQVNAGITEVVENLNSWEAFKAAITKVRKALSGPEGSKTGQDMSGRLLLAWLKMARQRGETKFPGVKSILNFMNKPVSPMQEIFGVNSYAQDSREQNQIIRNESKDGNTRHERLPGDKMSQEESLMTSLKAKSIHVFWSELMNALAAYIAFSVISFPGKIDPDKR